MDPRGPLEGAPGDSFEMPNIDKVTDTSISWPSDNSLSSVLCDPSKKINNKLLYLSVEYVDDSANRDYPRLFPNYEQVTFSPRVSSPLSDFEHRVSPLDPNMSSAARYSPTPVQLPPSPFHNPVVVLQNPPSPLISSGETNGQANISYTGELANPINEQSVSQGNTNANEESNLSNVENELILMEDAATEMEASAAPLMLTSITSSDFNLTRDFLVMQDEQLSAINANTSCPTLEMTGNQLVTTEEAQNSNKQSDVEPSSLITMKETPEKEKIVSQTEKKKTVSKKQAKKSKRRANDKEGFWCDSASDIEDNCSLQNVCTIADQPVPTRAIATLPESYLSLNKVSSGNGKNNVEYGVFAKRHIRRCTQFGPIEGILCIYDGTLFENSLPLLLETEAGEFLQIDISDENTSNWMRYVRPARTYSEQNLVIRQQGDGIVFLTTRNIFPKEELKAGPNADYAERRNLPVLRPATQEERDRRKHVIIRADSESNVAYKSGRHIKIFRGKNLKEKENSRQATCKEWKCSICFLIFRKSYLLNLHMLSHTGDTGIGIEEYRGVCPQCGLEFKKHSELIVHVGQHGRLAMSKSTKLAPLAGYKCSRCYKRFATKVRLQQHYLVHGAEDQKPLPCNICMKRFMNNSALSCHLKTHKETKQLFECPLCTQLFDQSSMLKDHIETHRNADSTFNCPHCQRTFVKYSVVRKHIRAHHCERKHMCQFCAKRFPTVDKLRMHLLKHSDHKEFRCANCSKGFKRKDKLKEHIIRMHSTQKPNQEQNQVKKIVPRVNPTDYNRFLYKCHECCVGFKRRGMLVNHLAKRHPDVAPESVPELNLPILRQTRDYYCQYCEKVYKSSSKRKAHIMKNHPGAAVPPSNRQKESEFSGLPDPTFSQAVGSITTSPHGCPWCHKQYASKAKLLQHQRKKHPNLMEPADQVPRSRSRPSQNQNQPPALIDGPFILSSFIPCEVTTNFFKPKIIKISNEVDLISNELEFIGPTFVRMRDMR